MHGTTKAKRNHNTRKKIAKRLRIIRSRYLDEEEVHSVCRIPRQFNAQPHRLAKDKYEGRSWNVHTNNKTKRHIHGNYYPSRDWKKTDKQKIDAMDYGMKELPQV